MNPQERKKLEKTVVEKLKTHIKKEDTVIVGVSGGPDSIFLMHLLKKTDCKIIVAHINHCLRGKESDKDEKFVESQSGELKVDYCVKRVEIKKLSKKEKKGLEEIGRKERYKFFRKLAKKYKAKYILTAHHAHDNTETAILNLVRGSSLQGLAGMKEIETLEENLFLLRPLLGISKKRILDYLKDKSIPFHTEKSNLDTRYTRNFIRHKVIPELEKINPNLNETISRNSQNIREINSFLELTAKNWINRNTLNKAFTKFKAESFRKKPRAIQKIIIRQIYKKLIGNTQNIESVHLDEVLKILNKNVGNKKKRLEKLIISIKFNIIHLEKT